jgi:hypothetical protein
MFIPVLWFFIFMGLFIAVFSGGANEKHLAVFMV